MRSVAHEESFFLQAEDGIRGVAVTGVQTCALPISLARAALLREGVAAEHVVYFGRSLGAAVTIDLARSEERRVGKECISRWLPSAYHDIQSHDAGKRTWLQGQPV